MPSVKHAKVGLGVILYFVVLIFFHYDYEWGQEEYIVNHIRFDEYKEVDRLSIIKASQNGQAEGVERTEAAANCKVHSKAIVTRSGSFSDRLMRAKRSVPKILWCENE